MDAVLFGGAPITDKSTMVNRVVEYVRRFYEGEVAEDTLLTWSAAAVDEIWGEGPRVTKYIPMLALRSVRVQVIESLEARLAAGEALPPEAARDTWVWDTMHLPTHGSASSAA